jgi:putative tricarboxylic transport membrane protein
MGAITLAVCAFLYLRTYDFPAFAALWPRVMLALLALLAAWIVYKGVRKTRAMRQGQAMEYEGEEERLSFQLVKSPLITFAVVIAYFFALTIIGFFPATVLFLAGFLWYGGARDWKVYVMTVVGVNVFIYLLFSVQLNVRLPPGLFL